MVGGIKDGVIRDHDASSVRDGQWKEESPQLSFLVHGFAFKRVPRPYCQSAF